MPTTGEIIAKIHEHIRELDPVAVANIASADLGAIKVNSMTLDSLQLLELGMKISDDFGTEVDILELPSDATFADVAASIAS